MTWTESKYIAFPAEHIGIANKLANVIDTDVGGAETFTLDRQENGYVFSWIPFIEDFWPLVQTRDANIWYAAMTQLAESRQREALTREEIETLCATIRFTQPEW